MTHQWQLKSFLYILPVYLNASYVSFLLLVASSSPSREWHVMAASRCDTSCAVHGSICNHGSANASHNNSHKRTRQQCTPLSSQFL